MQSGWKSSWRDDGERHVAASLIERNGLIVGHDGLMTDRDEGSDYALDFGKDVGTIEDEEERGCRYSGGEGAALPRRR